MKLEEIEKKVKNIKAITGKDIFVLTVKEAEHLLSLVKRYREGIGHIKEMGHNNDCLMCAMKDTLVNKLLDEPEGGKEKV